MIAAGLLEDLWAQVVAEHEATVQWSQRISGRLIDYDAVRDEIADVFLCHGQPVRSDELSDLYTNCPFDKVAEALDAVHAQLRPMFEAAPQAFTTPQTRRRR